MATSERTLQKVVLELLPLQGDWSEEAYLWLTDDTSRLIEFVDGYIELLPMPTDEHQSISGFLYRAFSFHLQPLGGIVLYAPLRIRIRTRKFREPDLLVLRDANDPRRQNRYWLGADLVVEIVSPDTPERDHVEKREDYAVAGVTEYWIVDPRQQTITVLALHEGQYQEHGVFARGAQATSALLAGFAVAVDDVLDAR
ncbi:MAG: Uma2 family endonuclease [Thermomicrobiales bacterium]|jgi:Uma2 family endonuclease